MKISKRPDNTQLQAWDIENVIPSAVGNVRLVKLLHSFPVAKLTIEPFNSDIFNHKYLFKQNNHTTKAN